MLICVVSVPIQLSPFVLVPDRSSIKGFCRVEFHRTQIVRAQETCSSNNWRIYIYNKQARIQDHRLRTRFAQRSGKDRKRKIERLESRVGLEATSKQKPLNRLVSTDYVILPSTFLLPPPTTDVSEDVEIDGVTHGCELLIY